MLNFPSCALIGLSFFIGYYYGHSKSLDKYIIRLVCATIDGFYDIKHALVGSKSRSVTSASADTPVPHTIVTGEKYTYYELGNYVYWTLNDDKSVPNKHRSDAIMESYEIVRHNYTGVESYLHWIIGRFIGPDADFNNKVPTAEVINEYLKAKGKECLDGSIDILITSCDGLKEYHISS